MHAHPPYYTTLLQCQLAGAPYLTARERRELDLHLLICPWCNYTYATWLRHRDPERADGLLRDLARRLTADYVAPYLEDLAAALSQSQSLTGFQTWLWDYVRRDRDALAQLRLAQARLAWREWSRDD
ncbi:MAG: hypothetical protein U9R05_08525 [Chloroflexota bacterium]|nr:hypothetical protein [Chloroflexota bacterium]